MAVVAVENGVDSSVFLSLTEDDLFRMFPGKVGYVRKVMMVQSELNAPLSAEEATGPEGDSDLPGVLQSPDVRSQLTAAPMAPRILDISKLSSPSMVSVGAGGDDVAEEAGSHQDLESSDVALQGPSSRLETPKTPMWNMFTTPQTWPQYSDRVVSALKSGNIMADWDALIAETAYFILKHHDMKAPSEYDDVGRLVSERWPCILFEEHGKKPWNHFVKRLSQKMRNIRWTRKRKMEQTKQPATTKRTAVAAADYSFEADGDSPEELLKADLLSELQKDKPDKAKIGHLQKLTFNLRKREKPTFHDYPFLLEEKFIKREFFLRQPEVSEASLQQNWTSLINMVTECTKQDRFENTEGEIGLLKYVDTKIAITKRVKKLQPAISVEKATYIPTSVASEAPRLVIISHEDDHELSNGFLLHDGNVVEMRDTKNVMEMVLFLSQAYYAWDLQYPIQYQVLGFLQLFLLKDRLSPFERSCSFFKFEKRLRSLQHVE
ncbi:uncharacterized protein LOC119736107 isoform X1 [Patiria miniata]|uniref:Uncharacterized protein n=1 Tax=Patiria miniata TaxID=46514 RepID=A0A914AQK9_PATMI|nr:uncharacterized protein LOC119736107 isoform X1 [Patiria miniata]